MGLLGSWHLASVFFPTPPWRVTQGAGIEFLRPRPMKPLPNPLPLAQLAGLNEDEGTSPLLFLDSLAPSIPTSWLLQGNTAAWFSLAGFFRQLPAANQRLVEVYHWGDSQIEGDRISDMLRKSWQSRWGGRGPGWVLPVTPAPNASLRSTVKGTIDRRAGFGRRRDKAALRLPFFAVNDAIDSARWRVQGNRKLNPHLAGWSQTEVWHSPMSPVSLSVKDSLLSLAPSNSQLALCSHALVNDALTIHFQSDTIFGVHLGSKRGVLVHNLPLRGSGGTLFDDVPQADWQQLKRRHPPSLILLQFGGNAVPGIQSRKEATWYAEQLKLNIDVLRSQFGGVPIVFIGPSDMGAGPEDYPGLPFVIQAINDMALETGVLVWDLQAVMGGPGSMPTWVERGWASDDHIHFTWRGAREVGKRLEMALNHEWRNMTVPEP